MKILTTQRAALGAALAIIVVVMTGCTPPPNAGEVMSKKHTPAWTQTILSCNADGVCTNTFINHPERWSIRVCDVRSGEPRAANDKPHCGSRSVSRSEYETIEVGQWWEKQS